jgi:hypothetical protein
MTQLTKLHFSLEAEKERKGKKEKPAAPESKPELLA